jgi:hypothetical protein
VHELLMIGTSAAAWAQHHPIAAGAAAIMTVALVAGPPVACWLVLRRSLSASRDGVHQIEQRLSQMNAAVELLTDTTESGLQSAFGEIQRLLNSEIDRLRTQPALQMRVVQAADDGRTAREIAQREGMSEGEAHLRMVLSKPAFSGKAAPAR